MIREVTVEFYGSGDTEITALFRLGDDGVVECKGNDLGFIEDGVNEPFDFTSKPVMPEDGEKFLETLLTLNGNSAYTAYVNTTDSPTDPSTVQVVE